MKNKKILVVLIMIFLICVISILVILNTKIVEINSKRFIVNQPYFFMTSLEEMTNINCSVTTGGGNVNTTFLQNVMGKDGNNTAIEINSIDQCSPYFEYKYTGLEPKELYSIHAYIKVNSINSNSSNYQRGVIMKLMESKASSEMIQETTDWIEKKFVGLSDKDGNLRVDFLLNECRGDVLFDDIKIMKVSNDQDFKIYVCTNDKGKKCRLVFGTDTVEGTSITDNEIEEFMQNILELREDLTNLTGIEVDNGNVDIIATNYFNSAAYVLGINGPERAEIQWMKNEIDLNSMHQNFLNGKDAEWVIAHEMGHQHTISQVNFETEYWGTALGLMAADRLNMKLNVNTDEHFGGYYDFYHNNYNNSFLNGEYSETGLLYITFNVILTLNSYNENLGYESLERTFAEIEQQESLSGKGNKFVNFILTWSKNSGYNIKDLFYNNSINDKNIIEDHFEIDEMDFKTVILSQNEYIYDGNEKRPEVTVKEGDTILKIETDYIVQYSNNICAGTATVTIVGIGEYSGSKEVEWKILPKSIEGVTITLNPERYVYDRQEKKPEVTVKDGSKTLTSGTDYTVAYSNNTNVGTATVTVTGKGNYTGSKTENFTITRAANVEIPTSPEDKIYNGLEQNCGIEVPEGVSVVQEGSTLSATNAGTYKVIYKIDDAENHTWADGTTENKEVTWQILPKSMEGLKVTLIHEPYKYDGQPKEPEVVVEYGEITLNKDEDFTVAYEDNVDFGIATVIITGIGNYTGERQSAFLINAKKIAIPESPSSKTYNGTLQNCGIEVPEGVSVVQEGSTLSATNVGTYTVIYELNDKNNCRWNDNSLESKEVTWQILPKSIEVTTITLSNRIIEYDGQEKKPEVIVTDGETTLIKDTDYTVAYEDNINVGIASVIVTGSGNYTGENEKHFVIKVKQISIPTSPEDKTYNGTEQECNITTPTGASIVTSGSTTKATNAGTYKVIYELNDKDNYRWTDNTVDNKEVEWQIEPKEVGVTWGSNTNFAYDGNTHAPTVTTPINGENGEKINIVVSGVASEVGNHMAVASITSVTGGQGKVSNYSLTGNEKTFTITRAANVEIPTSPQDKTYTGVEQDCGIEVPSGASIVTEGSTLSATNVGTYTVVYKIDDTKNYTWSDGTVENKEVSWKIVAKSIEGVTITLNPETYVYDGQEKKPEVTVKDGNKTLTNGTDYTVAYSNNTNVGTATVTVTGKGNYTGSKTANFTIIEKTLVSIVVANPPTKTNYKEGENFEPTGMVVEAIYNNEERVAVEGYTVEGGNNLTTSIEEVTIVYEEKGVRKTAIQPIIVTEKLVIDLGEYEEIKYGENKYIDSINPSTTVKELLENIDTNGTVEIYENEEKVENEYTIIKTGMKIKIVKEEEEIERVMVVNGDVNEDGKVDFSDIMTLNLHRLNKGKKLEGAQFVAADVTGDEKADFSDIARINLFRLGKIKKF